MYRNRSICLAPTGGTGRCNNRQALRIPWSFRPFFPSSVSRRVQPASTSTKPVGRMVHAVTCHAPAPWSLLGNYASCKSSSAASGNDSSRLVPDFSKLSTDASAQDKETMFPTETTDQIAHEQQAQQDSADEGVACLPEGPLYWRHEPFGYAIL